MRQRLCALTGLVVALTCAQAADAQTQNRVAVGLALSSRPTLQDESAGHTSVGFTWRIGHSKTGWAWQYGLGWYATDLEQPVAAEPTAFGELKIRPFVGGYGYTRVLGRTAVTAKLMGGFAFNSFELHPTFDDQYRRLLGARTVSADVSNGFVLKPEVSGWIDLSRKMGLQLSLAYTVARPEVTLSSTLGSDTRHINADVFTLRVGAVYSIF
jgi:hypothetical protein